MKRLLYHVGITTVILLTYCSCQKPQLAVYYHDYYRESPTATEPDTMKNYLDKDSIVNNKVSLKDWEYIITHIKKTNQHKNDIPEPHIVIKTDSLLFFVGMGESAYDENYDSVAISPKAIYLILKYSNYYNKVNREDLEYARLIDKFGIPKDYCFEYEKLSYNEWINRIKRMVTYHLQPDD